MQHIIYVTVNINVVAYIMLYEAELAVSYQVSYILCLTGKQIIDTYNFVPFFYQIVAEVWADKPCSSGDYRSQ